MATIRRGRVLIALGALALIPTALTACGGGGQSTADACKVIEDGMTDIQSDITDLSTAASSGDEDALADLISETSDSINKIDEQVTNEEVGAAFGDFADAYSNVSGVLAELGELDLTDPASADKATEISQKASDAQTGLTDSMSSLTELCG